MESDYKKYTELNVWIEARKLTGSIYQITESFPLKEQFGLTNQIRRCALSVPSNIAEGCGRNTKKDSVHFFYIARGSLYELETQIFLSTDLNYLTEHNSSILLEQLEVVRKLLNGFIRYYSTSL
jgi:four helix bundle protein